MPPFIRPMHEILQKAADEGRFFLFEHEVYSFLECFGISAPRWKFIPKEEIFSQESAQKLVEFGEELVLKIVSPQIVHKSDVGGVRCIPNTPEALVRALREMVDAVPRAFQARFPSAMPVDVRGVLIVEKQPFERAGLGSELLLSLRHNREFGPVLTAGIGGVEAEWIGSACRPQRLLTNDALVLSSFGAFLRRFRKTMAGERLLGRVRGSQPLCSPEALRTLYEAFQRLAQALDDGGETPAPGDAADSDGPCANAAGAKRPSSSQFVVTELEINPFAVVEGRLVALDGLLRFQPRRPGRAHPPQESVDALLRPRSIALIGASARGQNMGRIILRNLIEAGFDPAHLYAIRPGIEQLDGVRCVATIADLPERVDLLIVAVGAAQVPALLDEIIAVEKVVGVILIPGGMGEKAGGEAQETKLRERIEEARARGLPLVVNGGNCLGVVSRPGRYQTLFIPQEKLPLRLEPCDSASTHQGDGLALVSQSGAFLIGRLSKIGSLRPRYAISVGNQIDVTVVDHVRALLRDPGVRTLGLYVEGFADGDGLELCRAVREAVQTGREVIFYKAGRTSEGRQATAGHTASLAGDYALCESLLTQAGALVAQDFETFLGLLKISAFQGDSRWPWLSGQRAVERASDASPLDAAGSDAQSPPRRALPMRGASGQAWKAEARGPGRRLRIAALTNAGYEAVGIADALRGEGWDLELAALREATRARLQHVIAEAKLDALVDVRNPLDLTPMADDAAHEAAMDAFLEAPDVDAVLCSTVPLTPAMRTLFDSEAAALADELALPRRLKRLVEKSDKPLLVSIDSGALYDPLARAIEALGIPVFRSVDAAVQTLGRYAQGHQGGGRESNEEDEG